MIKLIIDTNTQINKQILKIRARFNFFMLLWVSVYKLHDIHGKLILENIYQLNKGINTIIKMKLGNQQTKNLFLLIS